jgi:hypothetical protein
MPPILGGQPAKVLHRYTLEMADGTHIRLSSTIRKVAELADIIQRRVFERLLPQDLEQFERHERLEFGPVVINRDGIHTGRSLLPWTEVDRVVVNGRYLAILRKGSWLCKSFVRVRRIPNVRLLLAICEYWLTYLALGEKSVPLASRLLAEDVP